MRLTVCAWVVSAAFLINSAGCYHYRVTAPGNAAGATEPRRVMANAYLWGIINDPDVIAENCVSEKLVQVHVTTNAGYILIAVVTLGLWVPLDVEWVCAKGDPPGGGLHP